MPVKKGKIIIAAHGGVGSSPYFKDGTKRAVTEAQQVLRKTRSVLRAAVAGAVSLEDDPRFNAGTGSYLRIDGSCIEMDAAVMDSAGHLGAVAAIQRVKNPVKVAYALINSPHNLLCGHGAVRFARLNGFSDYDPATPKAHQTFKKRLRQLRNGKLPSWANQKWQRLKRQLYFTGYLTDTIGVVATDGKNNFAVAASTGGTSLALPGRVGDSPLIGCGFYAGKYGAVTATGIGEEITRRMLSREVYEKIKQGLTTQKACEWGLTLFPPGIPVGIIAVSYNDYGVASNEKMAASVLIKCGDF